LLIPIFSFLYVPDNSVRQLTKQKICVMAMRDETMTCRSLQVQAVLAHITPAARLKE